MGHLQEYRGQHSPEIFDRFEIIAEPLGGFGNADRESRVYRRKEGPGVTYGSYVLKLAQERKGRGLYILVEHGGGIETLAISTGPDWQAMRDAFLALDPRTLYAVLYSTWSTAADVRRAAQDATATEWRQAVADKRIRKRAYPSRGTVKIWIEPARIEGESEQQFELRKIFAAPSKA